MKEQVIICPKCATRVPIIQALKKRIESELRATFEAEANKRCKEAKERNDKKFPAETNRLEAWLKKEAVRAESAEDSIICCARTFRLESLVPVHTSNISHTRRNKRKYSDLALIHR